ncbi:alpha/beta fold hydrolase [Chloracidobacterium validum]|uniref:Alpha/beta fold hydrolase n=1 Tax=Chloracidobacterium validum TaxID=2821543 RepID=A0ABX8BEZ0_9BACT|nr:alpha/beta fold hydrolase [Chloracidobacterium validum]QUW04085.1 alpha/beta fold hydrolase [Chloracidobacterium validum]
MPHITTNGVQLYVEDTGGDRPAVLFIAGLGYDEWFWAQSVAPYLRDDYRLVMPANRGAGRSDKPAGPYTTAQMAADMLGLLDALALEQVIVVGHSLGGFIAQELTLAAPNRVRKLVLAGTSFGGPQSIPPTPAALAVLMLDRTLDPMELIRRGLETAVAPAFLAAKPPMLDALIAYRLTTPVPPEAFQSQLMAGAAHDAADRIAAIGCPTLLVAGELDQVVPPGNVALLQAKLPQAESVVIPDAGHLFPIEKPQETATALADFFRR